MHDFPSLIAKKLFNSRLRAFTLIEVFVAMMAAVLIGSGAVASLLASERLSARMRVLTNARIILQRKINSALGVSFTTTSTPDILSITSASGVVFNDNGAFGPAKAWGAAKFAALARFTLAEMPDARVLVHCGPGDRAEARTIVRMAGHPSVQSLAGEERLPFGLAKALMRRAAVLVTSDSGPRHIAAAFQVPTVVLFGSMDPRLSRSDQPHLSEMRLDLPCSPCGRRVCPLVHHDCMRLLAVDDVGRTMMTLLGAAGAARWQRTG